MKSTYPAGLEAEPELRDLMNELAARIPHKWREVGIQLIKEEKLNCFTSPEPLHNFSSVFTTWKSETSSPYKWSTLIDVLKSPSVDETRLAEELMNKLT